MPVSLHSSEYYRKRAGELRVAASYSPTERDRGTLVRLAADFDELGDQAEDAERSDFARRAGC
jgi:hypothetical protein